MNNAFTLLNGDRYEHRIIQLFLRYFVIVNAIILSTQDLNCTKTPQLTNGRVYYLPMPLSLLQILDRMQIKLPSAGGQHKFHVLLTSSVAVGLANSQLKHTTHTNCHIYTLLPPDDGLLASPKHAEV
jgi:hypothetical protein